VKVSIKDLARLAGVSVATVTRALQDRPDVSRETKIRILELAREHNYRPNSLARSLVTSRTNTVGIIVPDLTNPFFPALVRGIESTLWQAGYTVFLGDTNYEMRKEKETVDELISRQVDGVIMAPIDPAGYGEWLEHIRAAELPFVSLTRLAHQDADTVVASDRQGARSAVEHLLALGARRILYLGNRTSRWANEERIEGYREALLAARVPLDEMLLRDAGSGTIEAGLAEMRKVIRSTLGFDAVIAFDDIMALGVRTALVESGKRVPGDVLLVGFDNIEISALPDISLTTVDIPKYELGRAAAQLLMERMSQVREQDGTKLEAPFREIVLKTTLVVRESTGGARKSGSAPPSGIHA
jgi:LacI family transcriptional regulator